MNRTLMDCHQIEDVPGLYIDAFQSDFLRKLKEEDIYIQGEEEEEEAEEKCCDTDGSAVASPASGIADEASSCCMNRGKSTINNNKRKQKGRRKQEGRQHRCCLILTHYHSDHYQNLPRGGGDNKYGGPNIPIHCSPVTASLLVNVHGVPSHLVVAHEYGQRWSYKYNNNTIIRPRRKHKSTGEKNGDDDDEEEEDKEVHITFYDANHCPGAAIVVVEMLSSSSSNEKEKETNSNQNNNNNNDNNKRKIHIHTGDMRYHPKMKSYPLLMKKRTNGSCNGTGNGGMDDIITDIDVDVLYLDTTYGRPKHTFQTQQDAINKIASQVEQCLLPTLSLPSGQEQEQNHQDKQENQKNAHHDDHSSQKAKEEGQQNNRHDYETTKSEVTEKRHRRFEQQQRHQHDDPKKEKCERTLVLLSCYSIGKEKVLWECSKRTNHLVYVSERKLRMMECIMTPQQRITTSSTGGTCSTKASSTSTFSPLSPSRSTTTEDANVLEADEDEDILPCHRLVERCTRDPHKTPIHVVPMGLAGEMWPYFQPNYRNCVDYYEDMIDSFTTNPAKISSPESETAVGISQQQTMKYDRIVAFIPTGWADGSNWNKKNAVSSRRVQCRKDPNKYIDVEIRLISYSEHSSMTELEEFVRYLRPRKIIPTVFKDENDRRRLEHLFSKYVDTSRAKLHFFKGMVSSSSSPSPTKGSMDTGMIERAAAKSKNGDGDVSRGLKTNIQGSRNKMVNNHSTSSSSTVKESLINESIEISGKTIVDLTASSDEEDQCVKLPKLSNGDRLSFSIPDDRSFSSPTQPMKECDKNKSSRKHCNFLTSTKPKSRPTRSTSKPKQKSPPGKRTLITQFFSTKKRTKDEGSS